VTARSAMAGLVLAFGLLCAAEAAEFQPGVKIEADGKPIDVEGGGVVPLAVDWNGDGKKDLLVGQYMDGKIRLYLNQGTDNAPVFKDFTYLQAGGKVISLPSM
jgi:hypothetical protein